MFTTNSAQNLGWKGSAKSKANARRATRTLQWNSFGNEDKNLKTGLREICENTSFSVAFFQAIFVSAKLQEVTLAEGKELLIN